MGDVILFAAFLGALWLATLAFLWRDLRRYRQGATFVGRAQLVLRGLNSFVLLAILVLLFVATRTEKRELLVYSAFACSLLILVLLMLAFIDVRQVARKHQQEHQRLVQSFRRSLVEVAAPPSASAAAKEAEEPGEEPFQPSPGNGRP